MSLLGCAGIGEAHFEELCFSLKTDWENLLKDNEIGMEGQ